jgi:outer membrane protein OmpA-like peptidoglycan-associated protein
MLITGGIAFGQTLNIKNKEAKQNNSDFVTATEIHDSIFGPTNVANGFGTQRDFKISRGYQESNSAWFKFTINRDTTLTFDIVPTNSKDDYDFILFKCSNPDCIKKIQSNEIRPDRWCFSINFDKNGSTGLSEYAITDYADAGPGFGYVSGLPVKAGDTYYLMVDFSENYDKIPNGFTIYFYNLWPAKPKILLQKRPSKNPSLPTPIVLENVLFETNKTILLKGSTVSLDKLVSQMQANKTMKIEVRGHTDNTGDEVKNKKLSEKRAKAIVDYLVSKKIDMTRLSYKGFGSKQPLASNDTEEGKKKNRRVEFVVIR